MTNFRSDRHPSATRVLPRARGVLALLLALGLLIAAAGCEEAKPKVKTPARALYLSAQTLKDQELFTEAVERFQQVADQNPGTLLGSYAYLQIAEIRAQQEEWDKAETNYRLFLAGNQNSHLTPYVLYQLARMSHKNSFTGVFFPTRETDRDQYPNRRIVQEYRRFYFLYPHSIYVDEVRELALDARVSMAEHERNVGDFYFRRGHYQAAAARYLYLLRTYPGYPDSQAVLKRLIDSYHRNQQPELAEELERLSLERLDEQEEPNQPASANAGPPPAHDAASAGASARP